METRIARSEKVRQLTLAAMLTAIVVVLQLLGSFIRFGTFSISLVLIPIVIGASLLGWQLGAWLGFVFSVVVLLSGDAAPFLAVNTFGTILTVLLKGTLAGLVSGLVYRTIADKGHPLIAVYAAAVVCPIVNTGVLLPHLLLGYDLRLGRCGRLPERRRLHHRRSGRLQLPV